jgi:excinuclease UvrABC helicase subunit UvrB
MGWILTALDDWAEMHEIEERLRQASLIRVDGVIDPLKALIIARLARASDRPVVVIAPDGDAADRIVQQIQALWSDVAAAEDDPKVLLLPSSETLIYEDTAPDPSQVGEKLSALRMLLSGEAEIVVASAAAAFQRTLPRDTLAPAAVSLRAGESHSMEGLLERLVARRASSRCGAASWTSTRPVACTRCGSSSSAMKWIRCGVSIRRASSPSARCRTWPSFRRGR